MMTALMIVETIIFSDYRGMERSLPGLLQKTPGKVILFHTMGRDVPKLGDRLLVIPDRAVMTPFVLAHLPKFTQRVA
jgi:hypothetical protein